jgi:haloalkane dehalogenase
MAILRTPDERFESLEDFPYAPHYVDVEGLRMHYVDKGSGHPILCLHGEPSWSYLYRRMIPTLARKGRVVAPDWIGFGRSDKLTEIEDYSFDLHHASLVAFLQTLDLWEITLVCQDWGGLLGLTVASELPDRFARLVIMNTFLPTGEEPLSEGFKQWLAFVERVGKKLQVGRLMARTFQREESQTPAVRAAYDAPFPGPEHRAGVAAFPLLVPRSPDDPGAAAMRQARERLATWEKPTLVLFSDGDPITAGADRFFRKLIPGTHAQPEITIEGAGHFLQEDKGPEIAGHIVAFLEREVRNR